VHQVGFIYKIKQGCTVKKTKKKIMRVCVFVGLAFQIIGNSYPLLV